METITKQVILERKFEDDFFYIPEYTPNAHLLMNDIFSLPENRRDFWMRINRIYELSRIAITSKSKNSSVLYGNPFIGEVGSKNWYLTPDQLIDGIEKYIPHLLLDFEWKLFDKIKRYKYEGRKIRGIQELMYCVSEFSGSLLYMGPQRFIEKHNRANPYWNWTFDEVSNDVDFFTQ